MTANKAINVRNPRSGEYDYQFIADTAEHIAHSAQRLRVGQETWNTNGVEYRVTVLKKFQAVLRDRQSEVISALSQDTGRQTIARQEFFGMLGSIDRWCGLAPSLTALSSQAAMSMPDVEIFQDASPYPLLGAISPWNFPLLLSFIDVTPALLAGCAAMIKPSEVTPRFADPLVDCINEVPELAAVLAIVRGDGVSGAELINHVDVVAFTGSVATGKKGAAAATGKFIPAFLELGGKDPALLLPGTNLERAATAVLRGSVSATGQACQSLERVYVHRSEADDFVNVLVEQSLSAMLSDGAPNQGCIGPLIFAKQADVISNHIDDALAKGAQVECGGEVIEKDNAFWIEPTVLTGVNHSMRVMTEETFGPIMPVMIYDDIESAIKLVNDTSYGLSAAVFGGDETQAIEVARRMNAGGISVNDAGMTSMLFETEKHAFGYSGMGPSRVGPAGLTRFLRRKSLYVNRGAVLPLSVFDESVTP